MSSPHARTRRALAHSASFPTQQLFVLALCRICEPIAFMSIFPYVYYMVSSFHVTGDDKKVAFYAGMVTSAFAFAEFSTGVVWGRLSDKFGRKPILLSGLAGTGISMLLFGFAPNLATALIARALGGLLNGNIGVLNTTVAEVVTVEAHQSRAFSIMPGIWCIGGIIGSGLGGTLADPVRSYPGYFERGSLFDKFPYLLPNLVCAFVVVMSMIVGILFLEETHDDLKNRRDVGLEAGQWLLGFFRSSSVLEKGSFMEESFHLLTETVDEQSSEYSSNQSSPALAPVSMGIAELQPQARPAFAMASSDPEKQSFAISTAFTRQVMIIIASYGLLAFHTISAEQLLPVLLSLPESQDAPQLPFKFHGGFALSTKAIGSVLSAQGIIQTFSTLLLFPFVSGKFGSLATFRLAIFSYPLLYVLVPYLTVLPHSLRMPAMYAALVWKVTAQAFAFPPMQILLANSAPSKRVLGTLNGTAASSASLCRALGPTLSGLIQSLGLSIGCLALPWWTGSTVACVGAVLSCFLVEQGRRHPQSRCELSYHAYIASPDAEMGASVAEQSATDANEDVEPLLAIVESGVSK